LQRVYIGIRGRVDQSSYKVAVWERLFSRENIEVTLSDAISVGSPVTTISTDYSDSYGYSVAFVFA